MDDRILSEIQNVIDSRKGGNPDESYVAGLLAKGGDKILKKVIEEAGEVLMASKDGGGELARRQGLSGLAEKAARTRG